MSNEPKQKPKPPRLLTLRTIEDAKAKAAAKRAEYTTQRKFPKKSA